MSIPLPAQPPQAFDREDLRRALQALDTPELLALGARLRREVDRLCLYLEILRGRPGYQAQLAACLICFDLARLGHATAQREFSALVPTIRALASDPVLLAELAGDDPYLLGLWGDCKNALDAADPRDEGHGLDHDVPLAGELDLLSEGDLDLDLSRLAEVARREQNARSFARITARQLGYDLENDVLPTRSGLSTSTAAEIEALEAYLQEAATYAPSVSLARGLSCLGQLFLAAHLRRHRLFGKPNPRRAEALRVGLAALPAGDASSLADAAALFQEEGAAVVGRFQKVSELLLDFVRYCSLERLDPLRPAAVEAYVAADRLPPPMFIAGDSRRRR